MPRDEFFEKKNKLQNDVIYMTTSLQAESFLIHDQQMTQRRIGEQGYNVHDLESENDRIMKRMQDMGLIESMDDRTRQRLKAMDLTRLARNNSILLYESKRSDQDSPLMENIKDALKLLDDILHKPMEKGPEEVYRKYEEAIALMGVYVETKHPAFSEGKKRKQKVVELRQNLMDEKARFKSVMDEQGAGGIPGEVRIPIDILEGKYLFKNDEATVQLDLRRIDLLSLNHKNGDKDGAEMKAIKDSFIRVVNLFDGPIETDRTAREQKLTEIRSAYRDLFGACDKYIGSHSPKSAEGKRRLSAIKKLRERSRLESDYITKVASRLLNNKPEEASWKEAFGNVTMMAEECMDSKIRTEVFLGENPPIRKVCDLFSAMTVMSEAHPYRYDMFSGEVMTEWLTKHLDKNMVDAVITERYLVMDVLAKKYNDILNNPVPKKFLKNENDDPMDEKLRRAYARLVLSSDPTFTLLKGLNSLQTTIVFGIDNSGSQFEKEGTNAGEYYRNRSRERRENMNAKDKAYVDDLGKFADELLKTEYKGLNEDAVGDYKNKLTETEQLRSKLILDKAVKLKRRVAADLYEDPAQEQHDIQETMNVVEGKAFVPVQRPANRMGFWSKVKNRMMVGYRYMFGATLGLLASVGLNTYYGAKKLFYEGDARANAQKKRNHDMVPGRKDEVFEDEVVEKDEYGEDTEVYSDVRRGPLIFEKLSAGDPEDPPEVTIMTSQAKRGSSVAVSGNNSGHAFIGLSYSRYNKMTKRKERYRLMIGFYQGGGIGTAAGAAMTGGAMIAGQIRSDYDNIYDVARRYQVKPGDINKILRAVEKYADKGYGIYKRNCSTFMVEMSKLIDLPVAKEFKEREFEFEGKTGILAETAMAGSKAGYYMGANAISSRMNKLDLTYQNFGQKLFTKEDLDRYYKTAGTAPTIKKGYSPGAVGETLRNAKSGELTASYEEHNKLKSDDFAMSIDKAANTLWAEVEKILPKGIRTPADEDFHISILMTGDGGLSRLSKNSTPDQIRAIYKRIRDVMKVVNRYYADVLGSDARLNKPVMELLSLYEGVLYAADQAYQALIEKEVKGDAGKLRYHFDKKAYTVNFIDKDGKRTTTKIPPGIYEGYLMMGKTPANAIKEYQRLSELKKKKTKELTDKEKAEKAKLRRFYALAENFASANRYLLEKDNYSEKDLNYAFSELPKMEKAAGSGERITGDLVNTKSASATYQGVILEKVFGGFSDLNLNEITDTNEVKQKLDDYTQERLTANEALAEQILKAYVKDKEGSAKELTENFINLIGNVCIIPAYEKKWGLENAGAEDLTELLPEGSKLHTWLVAKISAIQSDGGDK